MKPRPPTDSPAEPEGERPGDGGAVRYVRLLDEDVGPELWEEFSRDIRKACLKKPDLRPEVEEWVQEILKKVYEDLPKLRREGKNPWFYGLRVMEVKSKYEAVRKNIKARQTESLTTVGGREGEASASMRELPRPDVVDDPEKLYESEKEGAVQTEENFVRNFEECVLAALTDLPETKPEMVRNYYSLNTHDRKKRERLAKKYKLKSYGSLQTMISRLSDDIVEKVEECMRQGGFSLSELLAGKGGRGLVKRYIKNLFRRSAEL